MIVRLNKIVMDLTKLDWLSTELMPPEEELGDKRYRIAIQINGERLYVMADENEKTSQDILDSIIGLLKPKLLSSKGLN